MIYNEDVVKSYFSWDPLQDETFAPLIVGKGSIGGKGRSLLFGIKKLWDSDPDLKEKVTFPPSIFLSTEIYDNVFKQIKHPERLPFREPETIEKYFFHTTFPDYAEDAIRSFLKKIKDPIIVRSSSVLEDSVKYSFAGKYRSTFLINDQEDLEERVQEVINEIKRIYARIFFPIAMAYRDKHELGEDAMGIIIMRVSGKWRGKYYYPTLAGVGFSKYYQRWTTRINPDDGIIRLVFGMGTTSTKRGYARSFSLTMPTLRPEGQNPYKIMRHAQEHFQVVDKEQRDLVTVHIKNIWKEIIPYHDNFFDYAQLYTSDSEGGYFMRVCNARAILPKDSKICFTFEEFASKGKPFFARMKKILRELEESMGVPADIEFAYYPTEDIIEIVQARPLWMKENTVSDNMPDLTSKKVILQADRMVTDGIKEKIPYLVMVDHKHYAKTRDWYHIARSVGKVNTLLIKEKFILVAPGRVGSSNPLLGVPVRYDELTNCVCIVELGIPQEGFMPELSFGTHFFTDLEIDGILYMPVYKGEKNNIFDEEFFDSSDYTTKTDPAVRVYRGSFSVYSDGDKNRGVVIAD
jgi:hypothetical protein